MSTRIIVATLMLIVLPGVASAKDKALTLYGGYRDGGRFTDVDTGERLELQGSGAASLALDIGIDKSRQYQIFLSHQQTDLSLKGTSSAAGDAIGMKVTYLHIGGTYAWEGDAAKGPYVVGGIGATFFDPSGAYDDELRASGNLGFGYQVPFGRTFALRFEARGYATLVNSSGGLFCSGGCIISVKGDLITQGELMLGLSTRF